MSNESKNNINKVQSDIFNKLNGLAPVIMSGDERYAELVSPQVPITLIHLQRCHEDLFDSSAVITQISQSGGLLPIMDAEMMFMINGKDGTARPVSLYREGWSDSRCIYTEDNSVDSDIELELEQFMSQWLDTLIEQKFEQRELPHCEDICIT